ncbi:MAG: hypothetical protein V1742_00700 [Pseudomonadota bacterium]
MKRLVLSCLAVLIWCLVSAPPAEALVGDVQGPFGLDGSIRAIGLYIRNYDFQPFFKGDDADEFFQTVLRLTARGRPLSRLAYEVHLVQDVTYTSGASSATAGVFGRQGGQSRYRALDETWPWLDENETQGALWLDRINIKINLPRVDLTIGRQAVTFGKAWFWNPLDVYLPFDPRQFDRDYKAGVDAVRLDVALGSFSGVNLLGVFGRKLDLAGKFVDGDKDLHASWYGSSVLARVFTNFKAWDLALQGGKIYGGYQLGGGAVGELLGVQVRFETAYFWADDSPKLPFPFQGDLYEDFFTAVIGLGRHFPSSLDLEFELLYNDGGESRDLNLALLRFQNHAILQLGRYLAGLTVSYELTPLIKGQLAVIHSLSDSSIQVQPTLTWSLSDNADLLLGAGFNFGRRPKTGLFGAVQIESEFGTYQDQYFAEVKFYF